MAPMQPTQKRFRSVELTTESIIDASLSPSLSGNSKHASVLNENISQKSTSPTQTVENMCIDQQEPSSPISLPSSEGNHMSPVGEVTIDSQVASDSTNLISFQHIDETGKVSLIPLFNIEHPSKSTHDNSSIQRN